MSRKKHTKWIPTPTFLYRNYLYAKIASRLPREKFFLDVGAGNGMFLKKLSDLGFKGESIDISRNAVNFAKSQYKGSSDIKIKLGNIFTYSPKRKYGIVFSFETLEHVKDDELAIVKIYKLLDKGGNFIMSVPGHMSEWSTIDEIKGHYRRYERRELIRKVRKAGFKIETVWTYGFPFLWLLRQVSKTGKFINFSAGKRGKDFLGKQSSIQEEYNPEMERLVTNRFLTFLPFKIMDLFVNTDLGFGYIVVARKLFS